MTLKVDLIVDAYSQLRISGLTVQPTPEDLEVALMRLENMAAEWKARNICAGYNLEDDPDPNSNSNLKREDRHAFGTNLGVRLIPDFNKQVPQTLLAQASQSVSALSGRAAMKRIQQVPYPDRMPRGHGNTLRYNRWNRFYREQAAAPNSCDTNLMIEGDTNDFTEHFDAYLNNQEFIASYSITTDPALTLVSDSNTETDINYRITANDGANSTALDNQQVTIVMTTDAGRVVTRFVFFNITPNNEAA